MTSKELKHWRDGLLATIKPSTINRLCNAALCAAFELACQDKRIQNRHAWGIGLAGLPDAEEARNVVLDDRTVHLLSAAYDAGLGLLVDVLAATGTN